MAVQYLNEHGYQCIETHYTCRWGEIDIIAKRNDTLAFIEVKTRIDTRHGKPYEAFTYAKRKHLNRTIAYYIQTHQLQGQKLAVDLVSIILSSDKSISHIAIYQNVEI